MREGARGKGMCERERGKYGSWGEIGMAPRREKHKKSKRMRRENSGPRGDPCALPDHQSRGYTWEHGSPMSAIAKKHMIEGGDTVGERGASPCHSRQASSLGASFNSKPIVTVTFITAG